jgi:cytochrome c5
MRLRLLLTTVVVVAMMETSVVAQPCCCGTMHGGMMGHHGMHEMMRGRLPPGITPRDLPDPQSRGAKLVARDCAQCHAVPSPAMHSAKDWAVIAARMFDRMSSMEGMMGIEAPTGDEGQEILAYLKEHALRAVAPGAIPAPESSGAGTFRRVCSQCHALPNPDLHDAKEWAAVVERMGSNVKTMRKGSISRDEKKEILAYLAAHTHL